MAEPILTWFGKTSDETDFEYGEKLYAGTHREGHLVNAQFQLWNNRWGATDVDDFKNFALKLRFYHAEDASLLKYCSVSLSGEESLDMSIEGNYAILTIPHTVVLSGKKNEGDSSTCHDNYIELHFEFDAERQILKENDLKSLFIEIVKL